MHGPLSAADTNQAVVNTVRHASAAATGSGSGGFRRLAVLVDTENVSPTLAPSVLKAAAKFGQVELRRAFGAVANNGWDTALIRHAFLPVARTPKANGRNAADIELTIAAMDMLHDTRVDGFCLVSSDSDFAPLAVRLREAGRYVAGIGERKTPKAFIKVCDNFTYLEPNVDVANSETPDTDARDQRNTLIHLLANAIAPLRSEDGWVDIYAVGQSLRKIDPGFDPPHYGNKKLRALIQSCQPEVQIKPTQCTAFVRMNDQAASSRPTP